MTSFHEIFITLALASCITCRVIKTQSSSSNEEQRPKKDVVDSTVPRVEDFNDELQRLNTDIDLLRILTNRQLYGSLRNDGMVPKRDIRLKRSYFPHTTKNKMEWPQTENANIWRRNAHPKHSSYFLSIKGFDGTVMSYNSQYTYLDKIGSKLNNEDRVPNTMRPPTEPATNDDDMMVMYNGEEKKSEPEKPIWDMKPYRSTNNEKTLRFSRASYRKPNAVQAATSFLKNDELSPDNMILSNQEYWDDMGISRFPFHLSGSQTPSACTWAILSCCSISNGSVNQNCFGNLGCEVRNSNICRADFVEKAMEVATKYYKSNTEETKTR